MTWFALGRQRAYAPAGMALVLEASVKGFGKLFDSSITKSAGYYENGLMDFLFVEEEVLKTVDGFCEKTLQDPAFFYAFCAETIAKGKAFREFSEGLTKKDLASVSSSELIRHFASAEKLFVDFFSYGIIQNLMGYFQQNVLYKKT
ncbi:MAG: hypothetical protein V1834_02930, partial [Candidatus Micrarchaeota archaeon]